MKVRKGDRIAEFDLEKIKQEGFLDVYKRQIEGGVDIKELNIGSMAHSVGKVAVSKVVSLGKEDLKTFAKLKEHGIGFDVRKVPSDSKENMDEIIKKAEAELS